MSRHDLTDEPWTMIASCIPQQKPGPGRKRRDDRRTLHGSRFVLKTGCTGDDVPRLSGSPATCWRRVSRWSQDGTWEQLWRAL